MESEELVSMIDFFFIFVILVGGMFFDDCLIDGQDIFVYFLKKKLFGECILVYYYNGEFCVF